jgi:ankyrin repeat protein
MLVGVLVCAGAATVWNPGSTPPLHVVFDDVRERDHDALLAAVRADPRVVGWRDSLGYTPLHWAAAVDDAAAVRLLLDAGADPNARDLRGRTPLHIAAMSRIDSGDVLIKTLLARGAAADATDARGTTPLQFTQTSERADLARALVAAGASGPAKATEPTSSDTRMASAAAASTTTSPATAASSQSELRPRRPRPLGPRRLWARVNGLRPPPPPILRGDG